MRDFLQNFYTQQKDPRDKKLIKEWIHQIALHKCWDPETILEPYAQSGDEESEAQEEEKIALVVKKWRSCSIETVIVYRRIVLKIPPT